MLCKNDISLYLDRIGFSGETEANLPTLCRLQRCHLFSVPYETLDIINGVALDLSPAALFDKIVRRRRGGYCFELNALFAELLSSLGFDVRLHFARYLRGEKDIPKRRHEVLSVQLPEGRFLCDVGVGAPIPLHPVEISSRRQAQERGVWCFREDSVLGHVLCEETDGAFTDVYAFTDEHCFPQDFLTTSYFCETHPDSFFRQGLMVAVRTEEGRSTVSGREFRIFRGDSAEVFTPETEADFRAALKTHFGLEY